MKGKKRRAGKWNIFRKQEGERRYVVGEGC